MEFLLLFILHRCPDASRSQFWCFSSNLLAPLTLPWHSPVDQPCSPTCPSRNSSNTAPALPHMVNSIDRDWCPFKFTPAIVRRGPILPTSMFIIITAESWSQPYWEDDNPSQKHSHKRYSWASHLDVPEASPHTSMHTVVVARHFSQLGQGPAPPNCASSSYGPVTKGRCMQPMQETPIEADPGDHQGLHYWTQQDTFYVKPYPSRIGDLSSK